MPSMLTRVVFGVAAVGLTLTGCGDGAGPQDNPIDPTVTIGSQLWAGAQIWFEAAEEAPDIRLGSLPLAVDARRGDSVRFTIPDSVRGAHRISITWSGGTFAQDVTIAGFRRASVIPYGLEGRPLLAWPRNGEASLIGALSTETGRHLMQLTPATGFVRGLVTDVYLGNILARAPVPTPDPNVFLIERNAAPTQAWRLFPTPVLQKTYEGQINLRHAILLNDTLAIRTGQHHFYRVTLAPARPTIVEINGYEESRGFYRSPRGDVVATRVNGSPTGPPVFDGRTADTLYHVRELFRSYGVAFSADGATLFMTGPVRGQLDKHVLLALDSRTGTVKKRLDLGSFEPLIMIDEPGTPWIYIAAVPYSPRLEPKTPYVLVIDSRTTEIAGVMRAPSDVRCNRSCDEASIATGADGIYIVSYTSQNSSSVFGFDRLH